MVENPPANTGDMRDVESVSGLRNPLEYEVVTHSSVLAWEIPGTEEPGRLQFMVSQRVAR